MPAVAVPPSPNGLPTATTQSPTRGWPRSSKLTMGKAPPSTLNTARSVAGSRPISRAVRLRWSLVTTVILSAPSTTWLLVTMKPSGQMKKPDPEARIGALSWLPGIVGR